MDAKSGVRRGDLTTRWVELVVALLIVLGGAVVILDSLRVGISWAEDGPRAGYFPFFVGCILVVAGLWIAGRNVAVWRKLDGKIFANRDELKPVLAMLLPTIAYVVLIGVVGIYVASAIFILGFMLVIGRENFFKAAAISVGVPLALFMMFERWFLVPLPKGPLEAWLGF